MDFGIWDIFQVLGALGLFIYGMKVMSEGLQKAAGKGLRNILARMTKNRLSGIITGMLATIGVQSSSATTVMVVSFVNAGLLTLGASLGVIMGANIGTTVTAWMVAILGFKVSITPIAILLIGVSFWFLFSRKSKIKNIAEFIVGFGILFIGLDFLKGSVPDIKGNPEMLEFITGFTQWGFGSVLLFVVLGTLLTVIVQSSSAATAVTLTLLAQGWIPFELACAMVLGENIGTTITANIAAAIGNVHAKRAARFHSLFNFIGVAWMLILFYPFTRLVHDSIPGVYEFFSNTFGDGNYKKTSVLKDADLMGMALFHSTFNILNVLLLAWFVPLFEKLVIKWVKPKDDEDEDYKLQHITSGLMSTPELSIAEAKKEMDNFGKVIYKLSGNVNNLLFEKPKKFSKLMSKIKRREENTDEMQEEITKFLSSVSQKGLTESSSNQLQSLMRIANELESIADIFYALSIMEQRYLDEKFNTPEDIRKELSNYYNFMHTQVKTMIANLKLPVKEVNLQLVYDNETKMNNRRDELVKGMFTRIERKALSAKQGIFYVDVVRHIERVGDMIVNVNQALSGKNTDIDN